MRAERKTTNFQGLTSLHRGGGGVLEGLSPLQSTFKAASHYSNSGTRICTEAAAITRKVSEEEATFTAVAWA